MKFSIFKDMMVRPFSDTMTIIKKTTYKNFCKKLSPIQWSNKKLWVFKLLFWSGMIRLLPLVYKSIC